MNLMSSGHVNLISWGRELFKGSFELDVSGSYELDINEYL